MRATRIGLTPALIALACSGGGSSGGTPDAGSGGAGGTGGGQVPSHLVDIAVSSCETGGRIAYAIPAGSFETRSAKLTLAEGTVVTLDAAADPQSVFRSWTGDCTGTSTCTLTVDGPKQVGAEFGPKLSEARGWNFSVDDNFVSVSAPVFGPNGELAVFIEFAGQADLGGGQSLSANNGVAIVVYEADGTLRWSKLWSEREWAVRALRFVAGDLLAVGTRLKAWNADGFALTGIYRDAMFVRLDGATGTVDAATNATPQSSEEVGLAAISASGRIAILGSFGGTADLGGSELVADSANQTNEYIASFDANFQHQWSQAITGHNTFSRTLALDVNDAGSVAVGGSVQAHLQLPGQALTNPHSSESPYVAVFDAAGSLSYAKIYETTSGSNETHALALRNDGELLLAVNVRPPIDLGAGPLVALSTSLAGGEDLVLARLGATGAVLWNRRVLSEGLEQNFRMVHEGQTLTVLGELSDQQQDVDFGTGLVHAGARDVFVAQFSASDGATTWVRTFGCSDDDTRGSVTAQGARACFTGVFKGELDYGGSSPLAGDSYTALVCIAP
ncbi:MAG: hypothetical protein KF718_14870 [Polyangiaceae bacterium]|nr:hypothetical protein [Polyangiaceae bacterium]